MSFFVSSLRKAVGRKRSTPKEVEKQLQQPESDNSSPLRTRRAEIAPANKRNGFPRVSLDGYQFSKKLGEGTFATVMSARCKSSGKKMAVKMLKKARDLDFLQPGAGYSEGVTYDDVIDIFLGEIKIMERLGSHPNIVSTHGKGQHFIVLESAKVDLYTIRHAAGTGLPLKMAKNWTNEILQGVSYVHKMGYVHQDLKSSNILVFEDRTAKLCDFGLARKAEETMPVDRELVTLWYRAPELLMGSRTYTTRVDEWSIGCIVLELLLGHVPFQGHHEYVCNCSSVSHVNYNSDQLQKIFKVVGTPTDAEDLRGMACVKHFVDWPHIESRLSSTVQDALVGADARMKACLSMSDSEYQRMCREWVELVKSLLVLNPAKRMTCDEALKLRIFSKETPQLRTASSPSRTELPSPVSSSSLRERRRSQLSAESTEAGDSPLPPIVLDRSGAGSESTHSSFGRTSSAADGTLRRTDSAEILSRASSAQSEAEEQRVCGQRSATKSFTLKNMQTRAVDTPDLIIGPIMT